MRPALYPIEIAAAESAVAQLDNDELEYFAQIATPDPLWELRSSRNAGSEIVTEVTALGPYAIMAAIWAGAIVLDEARAQTEKRLRYWTRRLFGHNQAPAVPPSAKLDELDPAELAEVVSRYLMALGLDRTRSELIGAAVVGEMWKRRS
jgi:hypothetical protein